MFLVDANERGTDHPRVPSAVLPLATARWQHVNSRTVRANFRKTPNQWDATPLIRFDTGWNQVLPRFH